MIYTLIDKAIKLSDSQFHDDNIKIVKQILYDNSYPSQFIEKNIENRLKTLKNENIDNNDNNTDSNTTYVTLPLLNNSTLKLAKKLKKYDIKTVNTISNKLSGIVKKGKDRLEKGKSMNVVYQIYCKNCNSIYIGQTCRNLETRIDEHRKNINKESKQHTVISQHIINNDHQIDWKNIIVKDKEVKLGK